MVATVLRGGGVVESPSPGPAGGHYETVQDPDTGAITKVWVEDSSAPVAGRPRTDYTEIDVPCTARGFLDTGYRSPSNIGGYDIKGIQYEITEAVLMLFPATHSITRDDRITNIRGKNQVLVWQEEEVTQGSTARPTLFDVKGVTPVLDPWGRHIENQAVLVRSEVQ